MLALTLGAAACGGDDSTDSGGGSANTQSEDGGGTPATSSDGGPVKIAFSAPGADHGWMAAITENARNEAEALGNVDLQVAEA